MMRVLVWQNGRFSWGARPADPENANIGGRFISGSGLTRGGAIRSLKSELAYYRRHQVREEKYRNKVMTIEI